MRLSHNKMAQQTVKLSVRVSFAVKPHIPMPNGLNFGGSNVLKYLGSNPSNLGPIKPEALSDNSKCGRWRTSS